MLKNKSVLVTGGTGYLGRAICELAVGYGAKVFFTYYKNEEQAKEMEAKLSGAKGIQVNLRNVEDIEKKVKALYETQDKIDILINNAGISQIMPLSMIEAEDVDLVMDVNVKGTIFVTKAVVKGMIRHKQGVIVNMGSIAGSRLLDVPLTYAMSKAAITGMTFSLAGELKRFNIRVNSVIPGLMEGGVAKGVPAELREDFVKHCAVGRAGNSTDVAELVCFLASDKSSYINAQNIMIDGGV